MFANSREENFGINGVEIVFFFFSLSGSIYILIIYEQKYSEG